MNNNDIFKLDSNWREALEAHSNLMNSGIGNIMQSSSLTRGIDMGYMRALGGAASMLTETAGIIKKFQDDKYRNAIGLSSKMVESIKRDHAGIVDKKNYSSLISGLTEYSGALGAISDSGILELAYSMKAWQASMEHMSSEFANSYNSIITDSIKDLASGIRTINYNGLDFSFLEALKVDDFDIEYDNLGESNVDLQGVRDIVNAEIENVRISTEEQNGDLLFAINKLTETIKIDNGKSGKLNDIVIGVLINIISTLIIFIFTSSNLYAPSNADINHTIRVTKQIVRTLEVDNNFYNIIRIVTKDGLEVRRLNKMKSRVKYCLNFGDLIKIEHKNRNWSKISYKNLYTGEKEIGWVLTRYIKRLD